MCAAFALHIGDNGVIREPRIAFGGMAATPKRATHAEAVLSGADMARSTAQAAMHALVADYQPLTDMRASSNYRLEGGAQPAVALPARNAR